MLRAHHAYDIPVQKTLLVMTRFPKTGIPSYSISLQSPKLPF